MEYKYIREEWGKDLTVFYKEGWVVVALPIFNINDIPISNYNISAKSHKEVLDIREDAKVRIKEFFK